MICSPVHVFVLQWPGSPSSESNCIQKDTRLDLILNPNRCLMGERWVIIIMRRRIMAKCSLYINRNLETFLSKVEELCS